MANLFLITVPLIDAHRNYIVVYVGKTTLYGVGVFIAGWSAVGNRTLNEHLNQWRVIFQNRKLAEFSGQGHGLRIAFE